MMGVLAPEGACVTCNSSDRRAATSEHPSATAPTHRLPRWCGVTRTEGQTSPQTLQAGGQPHVPSRSPRGSVALAPEGGARRASCLSPEGPWD